MLENMQRIGAHHWGKMALFFAVILGAVATFTFLSSKVYASEAKLILRLGRENATLDPTAIFGQGTVVAIPPSLESPLGSIIEIVRSKIILEEVVARVGPAALLGAGAPENNPPTPPNDLASRARPAKFDQAVRALAKALTVEPVKKSSIILISYEGPSPEVAEAVVAALVELATDRYLHLNRNPRAHAFLTEQVSRLSKTLRQQEEKLRQMKQDTGLFAADGQRQAAVARLARVQDEMLLTNSALAATEKEVELLGQQLAELPAQVTTRTTGVPNQADDGLRAQLHTLQLREIDLALRYSADNPEVKQIRKQIEAARARFPGEQEASPREQLSTGPNKLHDDLQLTLLQKAPTVAGLKARQTALEKQLRDERLALGTLVENELRLARQQREVDLLASSYRKYAENLEQTQLDRALEAEKISDLSVAQPATFDPLPVRPRLALNLGLGLAFALAGAIALGWLLESWPRLTAPRQIDPVSPAPAEVPAG